MIIFLKEALLMGPHNMFLWRTGENYSRLFNNHSSLTDTWWWWFGILHSFHHYLSHTEIKEVWSQKALCHEAPYSHDRDLQGPVVQCVVSLTSSLRVISLTVLADSKHNILIFFAKKMWVAFALQKLLTFFQPKNFSIFAYHSIKILTNR